MAPTIELFPLLDNIIKELDQLAEQAYSSPDRSEWNYLPKLDQSAEMANEIHKKLIEMKPKIREFIIRVKKLDRDIADIVSREYEQLLQLTKEASDNKLVETHLRSSAKGFSRIREVLSKEFLENIMRTVKAAKANEALNDIRANEQKKGGQADLAKIPISELIKQGESHTLEFKETLEYDTHQNQGNKDVLHSSLKTIAGFLNAKGGSMLIGVDDLGKIRGVERDLSIIKRGNNDRFEQKIRNCLKDRFKPQPIGKVNISFERFMEGTVCRVDVQTSKEIVHLDNEVYVRDGNTTQKLEGRPLTDWVQERGQAANIGNDS